MLSFLRRGPWGPCGLKYFLVWPASQVPLVEAREGLVDWNRMYRDIGGTFYSRGPWGPCGLKSPTLSYSVFDRRSRPVRALWIEILSSKRLYVLLSSRPVRALWIEMLPGFSQYDRICVEAREGLVDWNNISHKCCDVMKVEAREGLVDWNIIVENNITEIERRGPWGPCGLKYG